MARARKSTRKTGAAPRRKTTTRRKTKSYGKRSGLSIQKLVGVAPALWKNMTESQRLALMVQSTETRKNALQRQLGRASLAGNAKAIETINAQIAVLNSDVFAGAASNAAKTGVF